MLGLSIIICLSLSCLLYSAAFPLIKSEVQITQLTFLRDVKFKFTATSIIKRSDTIKFLVEMISFESNRITTNLLNLENDAEYVF